MELSYSDAKILGLIMSPVKCVCVGGEVSENNKTVFKWLAVIKADLFFKSYKAKKMDYFKRS